MTTYLYIKVHNKTGLKYFGQTKHNPYKYKGSGTYWKRHLAIHGNDVSTFIYYSDTIVENVKRKALDFSKHNDIVLSKEWANLREEDGIWGSPIGANAGSKNGMFGKVGPNLNKTMNSVSESNKRRSKKVIAFGVEYQSANEAKNSCGIPHWKFWKYLKDHDNNDIAYITQPSFD